MVQINNVKTLSVFWLVVLAAELFFSTTSPAQLIKLKVGHPAVSVYELPPVVAKEAGIFAKNGLDVDVVYISGGSINLMALLGGNTQISQASAPEMINAFLAGHDAVFVAGGATTLDYWLMAKTDVKGPAQLKGGSLAISRYGSVSDFAARYLLTKLGLTPVTDVAIIEIGGTVERLAAVMTGRVTATVLNPPPSYTAVRQGLHILGDTSAFGLTFQYTAPVTTRKFIAEKPNVVRRYVKSFVEALHWMKTEREEGRKLAASHFRVRDKEAWDKAYDYAVADERMSPKQYPSLDGIKTVLDMLGEKDPRAKKIRPEQIVDMSFIKDLDESGFIDNLYKKQRR